MKCNILTGPGGPPHGGDPPASAGKMITACLHEHLEDSTPCWQCHALAASQWLICSACADSKLPHDCTAHIVSWVQI
jgi:hypothetical protein